MSDAFKCDVCGEYHDGKPAKELYEETHDRAQNTEYRVWAELCDGCLEEMKTNE